MVLQSSMLSPKIGFSFQTSGHEKRTAALAGGQSTQTSDVYEGSLLKLGRNTLERAIERGADRIHAGDNHDRDTRGDQAILDSRGA